MGRILLQWQLLEGRLLPQILILIIALKKEIFIHHILLSGRKILLHQLLRENEKLFTKVKQQKQVQGVTGSLYNVIITSGLDTIIN